MATIGKISMFMLVIYFVAYIIIHFIIGYNLKKYKEQKKEKPGNVEIEKTCKYLNIAFNWFPGVYVIFLIFALVN